MIVMWAAVIDTVFTTDDTGFYDGTNSAADHADFADIDPLEHALPVKKPNLIVAADWSGISLLVRMKS